MTLKTALLLGVLVSLAGCQRASVSQTASIEGQRPATAEPAAPAVDASADRGKDGPGATSDPGSASGDDVAGDPLTPATAEACTQRGGTWRRAGLMKLEVCDMPTQDAGKACRSDSECESVCVAPEGADPAGPVTGSCYRSTITVGTCLTLVEGGRIAQAQCTD